MNGVYETSSGNLKRASTGPLTAGAGETYRTDVPVPALRYKPGASGNHHRWSGSAWIEVAQPAVWLTTEYEWVIDFLEEFAGKWDNDHLQDHAWDSAVHGGGGPIAKVSSAIANDGPCYNFGVIRLNSGSTSGGGMNLGLGSNADPMLPGNQGWPDVWQCRVKCRVSTTNTNMEAFLGFGEGYVGAGYIPDDGHVNNISFVGMVMRAAGSAVNWEGISRDGSGSENETLVGQTILANDTFRNLGMQYDCTALTFFSDNGAGVMVARGASITNLPTSADLIPLMGVITNNTTGKKLDIDTFGLRVAGRRY